jgi:hypothetical protein
VGLPDRDPAIMTAAAARAGVIVAAGMAGQQRPGWVGCEVRAPAAPAWPVVVGVS